MTYSPLAVLLAAYNEEEGIAPTICELKEVLSEPYLVVVDGQSSDRTFELAKGLGADVILQRTKGKGKGDAISQGLCHLNGDASYVVLTDADYTYPAKHIKEMIYVLDQNPDVGMVLGDRFNKTYEHESDRNKFYLGNRILGFAQRLFNGVDLNDPYSGLRIVRSEVLKGWKPKSEGFDIEAEINHHVRKSGYKIVELPIMYRKRLGKKKLGFRDGLKILRRIIIETMTSYT
ncbi:MAG: glycosyltransferase family 2 protein [Candidatus Bathyarchaeota archaeon]|nr:glycosyltransferase family 2 protein [Candidatus Bathyarchaeum tardum]